MSDGARRARRWLARCVKMSLVCGGRQRALRQSGVETMRVPAFGAVTIYAPEGPPKQVVLFVSGDGGWNLGVVPMAERLRQAGALVVGIDIRAFMRSLEASATVRYPAGALEELSRAVQLRLELPAYERPILVGYSSGATLVYAAIAAAPPETFAGAISLGFCPTWMRRRRARCADCSDEEARGRRVTTWRHSPGRRCPGWCCKARWTRCATRTTRAFVARRAPRACSRCRRSATASACPRTGSRSSSRRIARSPSQAPRDASRASTAPAVADLSCERCRRPGAGHPTRWRSS